MTPKDYITIAISSLALLVSLTSALIAIRRQRQQMRTTLRDQLSDIAQELIKTMAENSVLQSEPVDRRDSQFFAKSSSFSLKLSSLARQANALMEQDRTLAFDVEHSVLAQALDVVGDSPAADQNWQAAVQASPSPYYRIINKRGYADFLFRQGRHEAGRNEYEEALSLWENSSDFKKATNGYTYQMWFVSEAWNLPAPHGRAEDCYRNALALLESISSSWMRAHFQHGLRAAVQASPAASLLSTVPSAGASAPQPSA